ncbi:MAG: hypothetical protein QOC77_252 [Thermoleophilaceae bacterium]|jgi:hypothetical protein|nr:hypothetical protein [Thermoleophilaceae bacterium]
MPSLRKGRGLSAQGAFAARIEGAQGRRAEALTR